jgi:hypothetical protein
MEWLKGIANLLAPYANVIAAFAAVLTAVVAIVALGSTARDSRDRSRPLVFAMFRESEHSDTSFELVVRNFGTSAARDLKVEFDPPFSDEARVDTLTDFVAKRYDNNIPLLPPGSELTNTWWGGGVSAGSNELTNRLSTPEEVVVKVSYKGNRFRRYSDDFKLHADTIKLRTHAVSSTSMPGRMKAIAESLKSIAAQTKATNSLVNDIGRRLLVQAGDSVNDDDPSIAKPRRVIQELLARLRPER